MIGTMSHIPAYDEVLASARAIGGAEVMDRRAASPFRIEIADAARLNQIRPAWTDLLVRADAPNAFMDPALMGVAARIAPREQHQSILVWKRRQLVGLLSFSIGRARKSILGARTIVVPAHVHGHLATPVIDKNDLDETLDALLDGIAADRRLPHIVTFDGIATDGPTFAALTRVLERRGTEPCVFERFNRPKLQSQLDGKAYLEQALSSGTRKKLRQHRRRLAEKGALTSVISSKPEDVRRDVEAFLAIEAAGWKGRRGTALLCAPNHAEFVRGAVLALADVGLASIHSLRLDGHPVSMQIVLRSGAAAFTWKTTYDERFRDFSPGMLLFEDYTNAFLADDGLDYVDSCALDDTSYMAAWTERQGVADLWIDVRRGGSIEFQVLSRIQKTYRDLRTTAKAVYLACQKARRH